MKYFKIVLAGSLVAVLWCAIAVVGGLRGWWLTPVAEPGDSAAFVAAATEMVDRASPGSVALIIMESGRTLTEYYAPQTPRDGEEVNRDTLFPTASFSKWPTAYAVMLLAEAGKIDLDAPISTYLTRWELPESGFDNDQVSVRRLLSHTAGLVDGLGFGDYEADEALPTLEESLSRPRGSDDEQAQIELGREPGSEWDYSGGGYLILQLIVEEVSGMSFGQYMQSAVFEPLGMTRSTYGYLGDLGNISGSYDRQGDPAPLYRYAAAGATGLSSSAADLSRFAQAQIPGSSVAPVLPLASVAAMREPHGREMGADIWGLGTMLFAPTAEGSFVFGHDGANDPSINSSVRINPDNGDAIIALSTGPAYLASRITYEWVLWQTGFPDFIQSNLAIESAKRPINIGLLMIAIGTIVMLVRQRRRRSPQADRESRQ